MTTFGPNQMQALANLLCPEGDDDDRPLQKERNPKQTEKYKSKAKPNVKIQAKVGRKDEFAIWKEGELERGATFKDIDDGRIEPKHEILFSQQVGAEDVYLGLSDRDPTTDHCETLIVKSLQKKEPPAGYPAPLLWFYASTGTEQ